MEGKEIQELFAKASTLDEGKQGYLTAEEWAAKRKLSGAITFKRRALGLCGKESTRSLDEMAILLNDTNIVGSLDEGKKLVPKLVGKRLDYGYLREISFDEVTDSDGDKAYRISAYSPRY